MADRTLTIINADGGSEIYTINRDKVAGVTSIVIDGTIVEIDHTASPNQQAKETTFTGSASFSLYRAVEPILTKVAGDAAFALSLFDLNDIRGSAKIVRVLRSWDGLEEDFTAKDYINGNLLKFVNGPYFGFTQNAQGKVVTWYEQSGNNVNAVKGDSVDQPFIVKNGVLQKGLIFNGLSDEDLTTSVDLENKDFSVFTVYTPDSDTFDGVLLGSSASSWMCRLLDSRLLFRGSDSVIHSLALNTPMTKGNRYIITVIRSNNVIKVYVNKEEQTATVTVAEAANFGFERIGVRGVSNQRLEGMVSELIVYPRDQTLNRAAIEANIVSQYPDELVWAICWGQSNMKGFGPINLPDVPNVSADNDSQIQYYDFTNIGAAGDTQGEFVGMDTAATYNTKWGNAQPFARRLNDKLPTCSIYMTKHSIGGRGIYGYNSYEGNTLGSDSYNPVTGIRYTDLIEKLKDAKSKLPRTPDKVIFWSYHGNRDGEYSESADDYSSNLQALINGVRTELEIDEGKFFPVIGLSHSIQQNSPSGDDVGCQYISTVRSQQVAAAAALNNAITVDADIYAPTLSSSSDDGTHLTAKAYDDIGTAAADAIVAQVL